MWLALTTKTGLQTRTRRSLPVHQRTLEDDIAMTPGVGNVYLGGYVDPNLRIWLNADKMAEREITVEDVLGRHHHRARGCPFRLYRQRPERI